MIVIGGGAIGCEFASTFADLGASVTILEGLPKILPGLDADLANVVVRSFKKKNIDIKTGVKVSGHTPNGFGGTRVTSDDDESIDVDAVVVSRRPPSVRRCARSARHRREGHRSWLRRGRRVLPHR
jgi:dihydrolipoamide dehydrogenase